MDAKEQSRIVEETLQDPAFQGAPPEPWPEREPNWYPPLPTKEEWYDLVQSLGTAMLWIAMFRDNFERSSIYYPRMAREYAERICAMNWLLHKFDKYALLQKGCKRPVAFKRG